MPLTCAHLVGSLPYPDADTTFREITRRLGGHLKRIPDGETGERARWIFWQRAKVAEHPAMEIAADEDMARIHQWDGKLIREWELFRFRPDVDPAAVEFDPGYAPEAIASYARFAALREAGTLPEGVRFQVCLPTPMAVGYWFVSPAARPDFFAAYERAFKADLAKICAAIPRGRPGDPVGRLPGGAGLGRLFPEPAGRATSRTSYGHAGAPRQRRAGAGGAWLPPLLRHAEGRACGDAGPTSPTRSRSYPWLRRRAGAFPPVRPRSGAETPGRRRPITRRLQTCACPKAASFISASSTTTTGRATGTAHRRRVADVRPPPSASRRNAAGAAATRPAPPACSTATGSCWKGADPRLPLPRVPR